MDMQNCFESVDNFQFELNRIAQIRKESKTKTPRKYNLSKAERKIIHMKTGGRCHICGIEIPLDKYQADHVKSHTSGGSSITENFLPACSLCNNYRWHYQPEELQWILKIGVWARTEIACDSMIGRLIGEKFVKKEQTRIRRRKPIA